MPSTDIPTEVVDKILENVDIVDKRNTILASRLVAKSWSYTTTRSLFVDLDFKGWDDMLRFTSIISGPAPPTFLLPIRSKRVTLNNLTAMNGKATSALQALVSAVETPESLAIHVTTGGINDILIVVGQGWTNITQVTLSGGVHPPATLFAHLALLLQLQSLTLQDFQLKDVEGGQGLPAVPLRFTTSVKKLTLDRSFSLWPFFGAHFLPGRGLANIDELCIREKFSWQEKGIRVMHERVRKLEGVPTLKLEAIYDNSPHLMEDMKAVFYNVYSRQRLPLVKIRGLSQLQLHLADVPAELALNCIGMYCLYLPATNVDVTVEIEVPRSVDLWDNSDPSSHFRQFLEETRSDPNDVANNARALLVVRGFPGTLPAEVGASGRAVVCGYPVVFMASRGEGAGM